MWLLQHHGHQDNCLRCVHYPFQNDLEWYDPSAATTKGGALKLTLSKVNNTLDNHNLQYRSGMVRPLFCRYS